MTLRQQLLFLFVVALLSLAVSVAAVLAWDYTHREPVALPTVTPVPQPILQKTQAAFATVPPPTVTPTVYIVQSGDTLGSIALQFDLTVDEIMQANGLTDPNLLSVGQTLVIPVVGFVQPTVTPLPSPTEAALVTPPPTGTAVSQTGTPQLAIRSITDAGSLSTEKITLVNLGDVVDLAGWTLADEQGNVYAFPALSLFQGGAVSIHTALGRDTVTDLYWGQPGAMWQSGETATLKDPQGGTHTTFTAP